MRTVLHGHALTDALRARRPRTGCATPSAGCGSRARSGGARPSPSRSSRWRPASRRGATTRARSRPRREGLAIAEEIEHRQWIAGARCALGAVYARPRRGGAGAGRRRAGPADRRGDRGAVVDQQRARRCWPGSSLAARRPGRGAGAGRGACWRPAARWPVRSAGGSWPRSRCAAATPAAALEAVDDLLAAVGPGGSSPRSSSSCAAGRWRRSAATPRPTSARARRAASPSARGSGRSSGAIDAARGALYRATGAP